MCGIVGYVSKINNQLNKKNTTKKSFNKHKISKNKYKLDALTVLVEGLKRLEYRGYDSTGVALIGPSGLQYSKKTGKLNNLIRKLQSNPLEKSYTGIGHTRWATHGKPSDSNAHPHLGDNGKLALIHNGIIENFLELKNNLLSKGYIFKSQTDTEVAVFSITDYYRKLLKKFPAKNRNNKNCLLTLAMQKACQNFKGTFTFLLIHEDYPQKIIAARRDSPLVIGVGNGENFLGSDISGFIKFTRKVIELDQNQIVSITPDKIDIMDFFGNKTYGKKYKVNWNISAVEKNGYSSYMLKEINEQPMVIKNTINKRHNFKNIIFYELEKIKNIFKNIERIVILGCGTAAYAGIISKYFIEDMCNISVDVELAHEFRYKRPILNRHTLIIAISQSGETMDTIMALRHAKSFQSTIISVCNTYGATITKESDAVLYTKAGPEVSVASTKSFLSQITVMYLFSLYLAQVKDIISSIYIKKNLKELNKISEKIQKILNEYNNITHLADELKNNSSILFLGRHINYPVAMEGALKLKELAYIHAEGFPAGELKHGPIALIDNNKPVFVIVPSQKKQKELYSKVISNIEEIKARGAYVIIITNENSNSLIHTYVDATIKVPHTNNIFLSPLINSVPFQIFASEMARLKGYPVDKPRNLAKSVTVE